MAKKPKNGSSSFSSILSVLKEVYRPGGLVDQGLINTNSITQTLNQLWSPGGLIDQGIFGSEAGKTWGIGGTIDQAALAAFGASLDGKPSTMPALEFLESLDQQDRDRRRQIEERRTAERREQRQAEFAETERKRLEQRSELGLPMPGEEGYEESANPDAYRRNREGEEQRQSMLDWFAKEYDKASQTGDYGDYARLYELRDRYPGLFADLMEERFPKKGPKDAAGLSTTIEKLRENQKNWRPDFSHLPEGNRTRQKYEQEQQEKHRRQILEAYKGSWFGRPGQQQPQQQQPQQQQPQQQQPASPEFPSPEQLSEWALGTPPTITASSQTSPQQPGTQFAQAQTTSPGGGGIGPSGVPPHLLTTMMGHTGGGQRDVGQPQQPGQSMVQQASSQGYGHEGLTPPQRNEKRNHEREMRRYQQEMERWRQRRQRAQDNNQDFFEPPPTEPLPPAFMDPGPQPGGQPTQPYAAPQPGWNAPSGTVAQPQQPRDQGAGGPGTELPQTPQADFGGGPEHRGSPGFNIRSGGEGQPGSPMNAALHRGLPGPGGQHEGALESGVFVDSQGKEWSTAALGAGPNPGTVPPQPGSPLNQLYAPGNYMSPEQAQGMLGNYGTQQYGQPATPASSNIPGMGARGGPYRGDYGTLGGVPPRPEWDADARPGIGDPASGMSAAYGGRGPLEGVASRPEFMAPEEREDVHTYGYTMNQADLDQMQVDVESDPHDRKMTKAYSEDQQKLAELSGQIEDPTSRKMVTDELRIVDEDPNLSPEQKMTKAVEIAQKRKVRERQDLLELNLDLAYGAGMGEHRFVNLLESISVGEVNFSEVYSSPYTSPAVKRELARIISDPTARNVLIPPRGNVNIGFNGGAGYEQATEGAWGEYTSSERSNYITQTTAAWNEAYKDVDPADRMPKDLWKMFNGPTKLLDDRYSAHVISQQSMNKEPLGREEWLELKEEQANKMWEHRKNAPQREAERKTRMATQRRENEEQKRNRQRRRDAEANRRSSDPMVRAMSFKHHPRWKNTTLEEQAADWSSSLSDKEQMTLHSLYTGSPIFSNLPQVKELEDVQAEILNAQMGVDSSGRSLGSDSAKAMSAAEAKYNQLLYLVSQSPMAQSYVAMQDAENAKYVPIFMEAVYQRQQEELNDIEQEKLRREQQQRIEMEQLRHENRMELARQNATFRGTSADGADGSLFKPTATQKDALFNQQIAQEIMITLEGEIIDDHPVTSEEALSIALYENENDSTRKLELASAYRNSKTHGLDDNQLQARMVKLAQAYYRTKTNLPVETYIKAMKRAGNPSQDNTTPSLGGAEPTTNGDFDSSQWMQAGLTEHAERHAERQAAASQTEPSVTFGEITGSTDRPWSSNVITPSTMHDIPAESFNLDFFANKVSERIVEPTSKYGEGPWPLSDDDHRKAIATIVDYIDDPGQHEREAIVDIYKAVMAQLNYEPKPEWLNK